MRRTFFGVVFLLCVFLVGCNPASKDIDKAILFREKILQSNGCEFNISVIADYYKEYLEFKMSCKCDPSGKILFEVISPASISGISGELSGEGGKLTFNDQALLFPMLAEGRISPISGPWVLMSALRSGYVNSCGSYDQGYVIMVDDSYHSNALQVMIKTDQAFIPKSVEIFEREQRILTLLVQNFKFV